MATKTPEQMAEEYAFKFYLNEDSGYAMTMNRDAFLAGYQAAKPQWISVKDRLPEDYVDVLWYDPISLQPMRVDMNGALWRADFTNGSVTHWMPLPEAPKE